MLNCTNKLGTQSAMVRAKQNNWANQNYLRSNSSDSFTQNNVSFEGVIIDPSVGKNGREAVEILTEAVKDGINDLAKEDKAVKKLQEAVKCFFGICFLVLLTLSLFYSRLFQWFMR